MHFLYWLLISQLLAFNAYAGIDETADEQVPAYWDYGLGVGLAHFPQYPASNQFTTFALPSPTFQYRGKVLRADDKDGAHLYLLKSSSVHIEMSGTGTPAVKSSDNHAREGMRDLPWMIALGPQLVYKPTEDWTLTLGIFQATSTDFSMTRFQGQVFESKISREWQYQLNSLPSKTKITLELQSASKEFNAVYFDVLAHDSRPDRQMYFSNAGFLSHEIGISQNIKSGRFSVFAGAYLSSYALSANRNSPLHKSDYSLTTAIGFNYVLGESRRPEVPESETSGVINRIRQRQLLKNVD